MACMEVKVGQFELTMKANARTPLYYRQIFHKDLLDAFSQDGKQVNLAADSIPEMAYVMAKVGEGADMSRLNEDTYAEWLEQFEPMDFYVAGEDIFGVYLGNMATTSKSKKKVSAKQSAN